MTTSAELVEKATEDLAPLSITNRVPPQLPSRANVVSSPSAMPARIPPQLPPRGNFLSRPPPYTSRDREADLNMMASKEWRAQDPRSSSTESLYPIRIGPIRRRTLLLVYIHGFMGNESSFQGFPSHVHNLLSIALNETHSVHTKIYPRYKSRKGIEFARDDFGKWLEPNIRYSTDVILLGHSMGGILAAEVALKPSNTPATGQPFRHRILGTVNLDTPFLGLHPGVISSGLSSLFRPAPETPDQHPRESSTARLDTAHSSTRESKSPPITGGETPSQGSVSSLTSPLSSPPSDDPWYDPPFPNDVRLKERTGWSNFMHFLNKHSDNLTAASKQYIVSHIEFGACLADYPALKARYDKLRSLEDADELAGRDRPGYRRPIRRIRFVNFYTASTGRPKPPKTPAGQMPDRDGYNRPIEVEMKDMSNDGLQSAPLSPTSNLSFAVDWKIQRSLTSPEQLGDRPLTSRSTRNPDRAIVTELPEMRYLDAAPIDDDDLPAQAETINSPQAVINSPEAVSDGTTTTLDSTSLEPALPAIPDVPVEPEPIDLTLYADKDARKIAEKEQKRLMKIYHQALKDRESAIKDRKKLADKREKKVRQELEKKLKAEHCKRLKSEKEAEKRKDSSEAPQSPGVQSMMSPMSATFPPIPKPESKSKKDRKFCMLPSKRGGKRDNCWVRVYMDGVDEVGAHCGLFFPGPQYEALVLDVGATIESWLSEDAIKRIALGEGDD